MHLGSIASTGALFVDLCDGHANWSQATFGSDKERNSEGPLKHLAKEVNEALDALKRDHAADFAEEMADCLLLVLDAARRGGIPGPALLRSAMEKLEKNRGRKWGAASPTEPVEHLR